MPTSVGARPLYSAATPSVRTTVARALPRPGQTPVEFTLKWPAACRHPTLHLAATNIAFVAWFVKVGTCARLQMLRADSSFI